MDGLPPKFRPFTKMRVVLALESTPQLAEQKTDITAFAPKPFTTGITVADEKVAKLEDNQNFLNESNDTNIPF